VTDEARRVVVVGAGIAGAAAAWELSLDHDVVLVEQEAQPGTHATGRSAAVLSETSGTREVCALARASRPFLESPPDGFADHPLTAPRGLLWAARREDADALARIEAVAASGVAPTARRLDASDACRVHPALRPESVAGGALYEPDARSVDVASLLHAYIGGARRRGAQVRTGAALIGATTTARPGAPRRWRVELADDVVHADVMVNAGGAWADVVAEKAGVAPIGLRPFRRTACLVPIDADPAWPLVMDVGSRWYFEPEAGGILLSPADESPSEPVDARPDELDVASALDALREATTLAPRSVRRAWAGLRTFAPDRVPVVGEDPDAPGFFWLAGQGGAGIKTAPALAACLAASVRGTAWPHSLTELGVTPAHLSPARFGSRGAGLM
jgi:D-arginine dehydrogenase